MNPGKRLVFLMFFAALSVGIAGAQPVTFPLSGDQVVDPVPNSYTGECTATLDQFEMTYEISCTSDIPPPTTAFIQTAPRGENGPFVYYFDEEGPPFSAVITAESLAANIAEHKILLLHIDFAEFISLLKAGNLYLEVTYDTIPGEIRGQIPPPPTNLYYPQFGNGEGFRSDIVLVNPATTGDPVTASVELLDPSGNPLDVGFEMQFEDGLPAQAGGTEVMLPPLGAATLRTSGQGELVVGSVHVLADNRVDGVVRFFSPGFGVAGVSAAEPLTAAVVPVRNEGSIRSAVAIRNTFSAEITVNLTLRTEGGTTEDSITVPLQGREAKFVDELFPELMGTEFSGALTIKVFEGSFAAIALEQGDGVFTTLPVAPVEVVEP